MSFLQLRYSEAYDASISGWTGILDENYFNDHYTEWLRDFVEPARIYVEGAQAFWDTINESVFEAFRQIGYRFVDIWPAYAVHQWPGVVGFKDPLTFFIGTSIDEVTVLLTHELVHCHEDYPANKLVYGKVREHIFERFAKEHVAVKYHIPTICVQWSVLRSTFPDRYQDLIALSCRHPLLQRCEEILNKYEGVMDYGDPLGSLTAL